VCGARFVDCVCVMSLCVRDARIAGACGMELRAQNAGFEGSERHPHMAFPAHESFGPNHVTNTATRVRQYQYGATDIVILTNE
jgi:hypothetical protein